MAKRSRFILRQEFFEKGRPYHRKTTALPSFRKMLFFESKLMIGLQIESTTLYLAISVATAVRLQYLNQYICDEHMKLYRKVLASHKLSDGHLNDSAN